MPDFSTRSYEKELLDQENIPFADIAVTLDELHFINTYLGGYNATRYGLNKLIKGQKKLKIADIGCGGGHHLIQIDQWCTANQISCDLVGIDMKKECTDYAAEQTADLPNVRYITSDYRLVDEEFDLINSCLFTHHLNEKELDEYIIWARNHSRVGVIINDLHRHPLAYHAIRILTQLFSRSYLVKNDASLSVLRSFKAKEWKKRVPGCEVHWNWAFRYTTIIRP
ncbi:methyltransferase domain-containing protein [Portibacter marinus]|uniref:methyltransferase domain-containing protein n=1 Tax=Portibacter marinus TaxID=2898660 RepID=UPI001F4204DF|nr:methyltransferase domain-containing protein [Portibacter marinus]